MKMKISQNRPQGYVKQQTWKPQRVINLTMEDKLCCRQNKHIRCCIRIVGLSELLLFVWMQSCGNCLLSALLVNRVYQIGTANSTYFVHCYVFTLKEHT